MREVNVRYGSLADMCSAKRHVRFAPNSDRKSGHLTDLKVTSCNIRASRFGFELDIHRRRPDAGVPRDLGDRLQVDAASARPVMSVRRPLCEEAPSRIA